jgi:hypothetical protein
LVVQAQACSCNGHRLITPGPRQALQPPRRRNSGHCLPTTHTIRGSPPCLFSSRRQMTAPLPTLPTSTHSLSLPPPRRPIKQPHTLCVSRPRKVHWQPPYVTMHGAAATSQAGQCPGLCLGETDGTMWPASASARGSPDQLAARAAAAADQLPAAAAACQESNEVTGQPPTLQASRRQSPPAPVPSHQLLRNEEAKLLGSSRRFKPGACGPQRRPPAAEAWAAARQLPGRRWSEPWPLSSRPGKLPLVRSTRPCSGTLPSLQAAPGGGRGGAGQGAAGRPSGGLQVVMCHVRARPWVQHAVPSMGLLTPVCRGLFCGYPSTNWKGIRKTALDKLGSRAPCVYLCVDVTPTGEALGCNGHTYTHGAEPAAKQPLT